MFTVTDFDQRIVNGEKKRRESQCLSYLMVKLTSSLCMQVISMRPVASTCFGNVCHWSLADQLNWILEKQ